MQLPKALHQQLAKSKTAPIFHVDDDDVFIEVVQRYHKKSGLNNPYKPYYDGDSFIAALSKMKAEGAELPLLVLLDINMPGKDGFDVLREIRENDAFKDIPICSMLSSSIYEGDIKKSQQFGANGYLVKPDDAKEYVKFFEEIAKSVSGASA